MGSDGPRLTQQTAALPTWAGHCTLHTLHSHQLAPAVAQQYLRGGSGLEAQLQALGNNSSPAGTAGCCDSVRGIVPSVSSGLAVAPKQLSCRALYS